MSLIFQSKVGEATYSQSARISSSFLYPNNWRLALAHLKPHDGGLYHVDDDDGDDDCDGIYGDDGDVDDYDYDGLITALTIMIVNNLHYVPWDLDK